MQTLIRKEIKIGEDKYYLLTYMDDFGKVRKNAFTEDGRIIIENVDDIEIDMENQLFLVRDSIEINNKLTGTIFYYTNLKGVPLGLCFNNIYPDEYYPISFKSHVDYLLNYNEFKDEIRLHIQKLANFKYDNSKMQSLGLALYKKRMIESENKI